MSHPPPLSGVSCCVCIVVDMEIFKYLFVFIYFVFTKEGER